MNYKLAPPEDLLRTVNIKINDKLHYIYEIYALWNRVYLLVSGKA